MQYIYIHLKNKGASKGSSEVKGSLWNHLDKKKFFYGFVKHLYFTDTINIITEE